MDLKHIFRKHAERYTIVTAVRKADDIHLRESYTSNDRATILGKADELANTMDANTLIAVIDWTDKTHWRDGRRIAHYGEI